MEGNTEKLTTLSRAVETYVKEGSHISIGGFTINRNPMAAVREIIRRKLRNLHLYAHSNGQGLDELIGGGCVSRVELAYGGNGKFASTCIRFKRAVREGSVLVEDYSNYHMSLRFLAGAMGLPFLPTRSGLGSDILTVWGFPEEMRAEDPTLPDRKLTVMDNPLGDWGEAKKLVAVPAIFPDVTIIHVQKADPRGTCRIEGLPFGDVEQARAAKHLIVTCEEVVDTETLSREPERNQLPFVHADAVVHLPFGAYPTACHNHYDYDPDYLKGYAAAAGDDALYERHLSDTIHAREGHDDFLRHVGEARLAAIRADKNRGYAKNLRRN